MAKNQFDILTNLFTSYKIYFVQNLSKLCPWWKIVLILLRLVRFYSGFILNLLQNQECMKLQRTKDKITNSTKSDFLKIATQKHETLKV